VSDCDTIFWAVEFWVVENAIIVGCRKKLWVAGRIIFFLPCRTHIFFAWPNTYFFCLAWYWVFESIILGSTKYVFWVVESMILGAERMILGGRKHWWMLWPEAPPFALAAPLFFCGWAHIFFFLIGRLDHPKNLWSCSTQTKFGWPKRGQFFFFTKERLDPRRAHKKFLDVHIYGGYTWGGARPNLRVEWPNIFFVPAAYFL